MSTAITYVNDKFNQGTMKEDASSVLLNNVNVQVTNPANPAGTTSTTLVQAGLGVTYTPKSTGRLLIIVTGEVNNNTADDGAQVKLVYGTGTAPANGAAATGTAISPAYTVTVSLASQNFPFTLISTVNLTVGTQYWFDLQFAAVTGGTASLSNITVTIIEL